MSNCLCNIKQYFEGKEAQDYINSHLIIIKVDSIKWQTLYKCPFTNKLWVEYYPYAEAHGGGPPALKQVSREFTEKDFL